MLELKEAMIVSEEFDGTSKDDIRTDVLNKIYDVAKEADWGYLDQDEIDEFLMPQVDVTDTEDGRVRVEVRAEYSDYDAQRKMGEALDEIIRKYDEDSYFDDEDPGILVAYLNAEINESLQEDNIADRVRASQDIKEMTRRSIQLIGNYVQYYKDHPDEIDDSNRDLIKDTEAAYNKLKSEFEATYSTSLDEANYGGAYDIDPEMYFTRDDYVDFANQIIDEVAEDTDVNLELDDINVIDNKHVRFVFFSVMDTYTTDVYIDYRRVRKPSDLSRYLDAAVKDIEGKINEYRGMYEGLQLKLDESIDDFNEYSGNVTYNAYKTIADMRKYLKSHPDSKSDINSLRNQVRDIYANAYLESLHESLEGEDGWGEEISDLFYDFLRETDNLAYEIRNTVRGAETGAKTVSELVVWLRELSSQLEDIIGNLEGSEDVLEEDFHVGDEVEWDEDDSTKSTGVIKSFTLTTKITDNGCTQIPAANINGQEIPVEKLRLKEEQSKVNFKDVHLCQGCGKPLSQCTCEVEEESLELDHV